MRLSNTFLLQAVWAVAITGLMMLSAAIASADIMQADIIYRDIWTGIDPDVNDWVRHGEFKVSFDPATVNVFDPDYPGVGRPDTVQFLIETNHNYGTYAWDDSPQGWIDVQAQEWDLIVDGVSCACFGGGDPLEPLRSLFVPDSIRLVNDGVDNFVERTTSIAGNMVTVRESAENIGLEWRNVSIVPEASSLVLLALGGLFLLCFKVRG